MSIPSLTFAVVNGVPTYTADIAVPFTGTLVFGVGRRDETAPTAGTAHLLEHLVMNRVGKVTINHNASTDDETISFYAQGNRGHVIDFIQRVARAIMTLHDITDADVDEQRKIIAAELGDGDEHPGRGALLDRFGAQSVGLLDVGSPGHRSLARDAALSFADRWLHAGNAVITFTGSIPDDFDIELPLAKPVPARLDPSVIRQGAWVSNGDVPLCISLVLEPGDNLNAGVLATGIIANALFAELRTSRQLVYSVQLFVATLGKSTRFIAYSLDPRASDTLPAASAALDVIRGLAGGALTAETLRDACDEWGQAREDPAWQAESLDSLAESIVRGRRAPDDLEIDETYSATVEEVRSVIANALPSLFVTFGTDALEADDAAAVTTALRLPFVDLPTPLYSTLSKGELFKRMMQSGVETFNARMFRGMGGNQLVIDHDRLAWVAPDGVMEIRYDEVALAAYSEKHRVWTVLAVGGDMVMLDRDDWRGEAKAHTLLTERLPQDRQILVHAADG